jgi:hypothetical protein
VTDGITTKQVTVSNFEVRSIDWVADTISGIGTPNASGAVWGPGWWEPFVVNATGHWQIDLAGRSDIKPEDQGFAIEQDDEGDGTQFNWQIPWFIAQPTGRQVISYGWRAGSLVTLSVDDPDIPGSPDYMATQSPILMGDLSQTQAIFDLEAATALEPGTVVTLTDGIMSKTHTIMNVVVTGMDPEADTVSGTAEPGAVVTVGHLCIGNTCTWRHVTTDGNGNWIADFSIPGAGNDEQGLFNIQPGTSSWVNQRDEDRDETSIQWSVPNIFIEAWKMGWSDRVDGYDWPLNSTVTLTVDDPANGAGVDYMSTMEVRVTEWNSNQTRVSFNLRPFRLSPGAVIELTDGPTPFLI